MGHFKKCKFRIFYKKIRMAIFPIIRLRFSSGHRKWHTSFLEKSLSRNSFLDLKSCGLPPRKKDTILVRFSSSLKVSFPNFLSKNGEVVHLSSWLFMAFSTFCIMGCKSSIISLSCSRLFIVSPHMGHLSPTLSLVRRAFAWSSMRRCIVS